MNKKTMAIIAGCIVTGLVAVGIFVSANATVDVWTYAYNIDGGTQLLEDYMIVTEVPKSEVTDDTFRADADLSEIIGRMVDATVKSGDIVTISNVRDLTEAEVALLNADAAIEIGDPENGVMPELDTDADDATEEVMPAL